MSAAGSKPLTEWSDRSLLGRVLLAALLKDQDDVCLVLKEMLRRGTCSELIAAIERESAANEQDPDEGASP